MIPKLTNAQKIGIAIIILTLLAYIFFYNDVYGFVFGGLLGTGIGLLLWSKDPKSK